ncbi:zinc ribbon domain-containing protein [Lentibacillus saliphilus]|uniref:zinc ribbon domain-containing protein n=1 Tax=Lentibacillus saliphilus TaxID=2737028 RepID=UPI001C302976|nr:zinc ribbon domain-containing protein [Lentibacillus saliphilus]
MQCPQCGKHTDEGNFCMHCGAPLQQEESAATADASHTVDDQAAIQTEQASDTEEKQTNDTVEAIKQTAVNFGQFFMKLVKKPSEAANISGQEMVSGIISMSVYTLLYALGFFVLMKKMSSFIGGFGGMFGYGMSVSFVDGFLMPLLLFILLFAIAMGLTFAALKLTASSAVSIQAVVAKFGAYLIPYTLLLAIGMIFMLIGIGTVGFLAIIISLFGILLIIPTFILNDITVTGMDRIYALLIVYTVNLIAFGYIMRSAGLGGIGSLF